MRTGLQAWQGVGPGLEGRRQLACPAAAGSAVRSAWRLAAAARWHGSCDAQACCGLPRGLGLPHTYCACRRCLSPPLRHPHRVLRGTPCGQALARYVLRAEPLGRRRHRLDCERLPPACLRHSCEHPCLRFSQSPRRFAAIVTAVAVQLPCAPGLRQLRLRRGMWARAGQARIQFDHLEHFGPIQGPARPCCCCCEMLLECSEKRRRTPGLLLLRLMTVSTVPWCSLLQTQVRLRGRYPRWTCAESRLHAAHKSASKFRQRGSSCAHAWVSDSTCLRVRVECKRMSGRRIRDTAENLYVQSIHLI